MDRGWDAGSFAIGWGRGVGIMGKGGRKGWGKWLYGPKDFTWILWAAVLGRGWKLRSVWLGICHVENAKILMEIQKKISKNIEKGLFKFEILL